MQDIFKLCKSGHSINWKKTVSARNLLYSDIKFNTGQHLQHQYKPKKFSLNICSQYTLDDKKEKKNEDICQLPFEYGKNKLRKIRTKMMTKVLFLSNDTCTYF